MKILWVASEAFPFAKAGGLGDVSNGLPKALKKVGYDIRLLIPKYDWINSVKYNLALVSDNIPLNEEDTFSLWQSFLPKSKVPIYFVEAEVFEGTDIYEGEEIRKFLFLSETALVIPQIIRWEPDIFHANDWHTATVPVFAKACKKYSNIMSDRRFILTIHNLAFQGPIPLSEYESRGIDSLAIKRFVDRGGSARAMRLGIHFSDRVTTVSPTYAREVTETEWGFGLQEDLKTKGDKFRGILNGIDFEEWNPATDPNLVKNYSAKNLEGKKKCKSMLQKESELPVDESVFVVGLVARMTSQKGFDIVIDALPKIFEEKIQLVVLGTGEPDIENQLLSASEEWKGKLAVFLKYDETHSRRIYAGSDAFLIPSRFEPCGLTQMYAMRYGSVPIAHRVGGLADTVFESRNDQTGFVFKNYSSDDLCSAVLRALETFREKQITWTRLVNRIMSIDNSWESRIPSWKEVLEALI